MTLRILLFIITTCMVHAVSASDISMRVGYAYDIKSSKLLYVESHFEIYQDNLLQSSRVVYTDVEDNIIAKKNLDFTHHLFMPEFSLSNLQTGHSETANIEQQRYQLAFSNSSLENDRQGTIKLPSDGISDAGFDNFIKQHWDELEDGEIFTQRFLVPELMRFIRFEMSMKQSIDARGIELHQLTIKPANPLLRALSGPIRLYYQQDQQLVRYEGLSNLRDAEGDNYRVTIHYRTIGNLETTSATVSL